MAKFEAYRTRGQIWCERCGHPFPLEIVCFQQHRFALGCGIMQEVDEGDNIVWQGKWRYDSQKGLLFPHSDLLKNVRHRRDARASGRRFLLPQIHGALFQVREWRFPGCPEAATCPHCRAQNRFNAVKLRVSPRKVRLPPEEPSTMLTGT
jgi:hypothetical protein